MSTALVNLAQALGSGVGPGVEPGASADSMPLPPLRQDLQLAPGPRTGAGAPTWQLYDPLRDVFFRLGWLEFECLQRWSLGHIAPLVDAVNRQTSLHSDAQSVQSLIDFLARHNLLDCEPVRPQPPHPVWRILSQFIKPAVFWRIPLGDPNPVLDQLRWLQPLLTFMFRHPVMTVAPVLLLFLLLPSHGSELAAAQAGWLSADRVPLILIALVLGKVVHEIAHGLVARHFGVRPKQAGIAMIFALPLPYIEITDAWRLSSTAARLAITMAGIASELLLGAVALLLWLQWPDGLVRDALLYVAVVTWLISLLVNLNPFIRFDGYYALCDALQMDNLQPRAFAMLRWQLALGLFGIADAAPEAATRQQKSVLLSYALGAICYRALLYVGVAWLALGFLHPALALPLLLAGIAVMIVRPVLGFLQAALQQRARWKKTTLRRTVLLCGLLLVALLLPLPTAITGTAVIRMQSVNTLYAPESGVLRVVAEAGPVAAGESLFHIEVPELARDIRAARLTLAAYEAQAGRPVLHNSELISEEEVFAARAQLSVLLERSQRLHLRAPVSGNFEPIPSLQSGQWLDTRTVLARLIPERPELFVEAYLTSDSLRGFDPVHSEFLFYPHRGTAKPQVLSWAGQEQIYRQDELTLARFDPVSRQILEDMHAAAAHGQGIVRLFFRPEAVEVKNLDNTQMMDELGTVRISLPSGSVLGWIAERSWFALRRDTGIF